MHQPLRRVKLLGMRIAYPLKFAKRDQASPAVFRDVPEAVVPVDAAPEQVFAAAQESLVAALRGYVKARRDIPLPTYQRRRRDVVAPPLLIAAKLCLYQTMRDQNVSNVALAKRLDTVEGTVRRLVDPCHRSHVGQVEEALAELGKRLILEMWID